jgi:hypothetical protein
MRAPRSTVDHYEEVLDVQAVAKLPCTDRIRTDIAIRPGIDLASEVVSQSAEFGYIYRYDVTEAANDGIGGRGAVRSVFVVWTTDCEKFRIASYPTFTLPHVTSK